MAKNSSSEIDLIFEKCSKFFGEMQKMCDAYIKKNPKSRSRRGSKRSKQDKDPNAPKKPITAYILYFKDRKQVYVDQNQNLPITDITKLIGREWKELPKEKQQAYVDKAFSDKARYAKDMEVYLKKTKDAAIVPEEEISKDTSKKPKKLIKLSEIKKEDKEKKLEEKDEAIDENEDEDEEEVEEIEQEVEEEEEEQDEDEDEEETHNGKTKRGNFLATSSDNDIEEKIKKKVRK